MAKKQTPVTYCEVFKYFSSASKYAVDCSDARKRSIRRFADNVVLEDGVLFYIRDSECKRRWISDKKTQQEILQSLHDDPSGGCHFGRDKTRDKVVKRYYWHGQYEDIDNYVKTCEKCQKVNTIMHGRAYKHSPCMCRLIPSSISQYHS